MKEHFNIVIPRVTDLFKWSKIIVCLILSFIIVFPILGYKTIPAIISFIILYDQEEHFNIKIFVTNIASILLLFNTIIPLSLQFFFNMCSLVISKRIEKICDVKINSNGIRCFQTTPKYIVTDKTGT